jgi:two-component system, LytTR family, response regulator
MKFRCMIVEDEPETCALIRQELEEIDCLEVVAEATSVKKAYKLIQMQEPDALFLDIRLIGGTALHLLEQLQMNHIAVPPIVLMTAYTEEFAPQFFNSAFKSTIVHYIKKPFDNELSSQLLQAVNKIKAYWDEKRMPNAPHNEYFYIDTTTEIQQIKCEDILWIESNYKQDQTNDGIKIITATKQYRTKMSLRAAYQNLPANFIQISKKCVVNKKQVRSIIRKDANGDPGVLMPFKEAPLLIGSDYYSAVLRIFGGGNEKKK